MSKSGFILFFGMIHSLGVVAQATPELILPKHSDGVIRLNISTFASEMVETFGYDHLAVFVENDVKKYPSNRATQGQYTTKGNYLIFKPYFPFEKGMTYIVKTKNADSDTYSYHSFQIEKKETVGDAKVINIYPSAEQLPENLLRFYIYFNTPMKKGQALKHIQLIDAEGNTDKHAFMQFKEELWSGDGKRLTILFDPGRIKRGVSTNMRRGPALEATNQYQIRISNTWQDVYGQPLETTTKDIEVVEAYRTKIKANEWRINQPKAQSYEALTVHFDRIMDHALIQSMIQLKDRKGNPLAGYWEISEQEQQIQFIPEKKWKKGKYQIVIDSRLEDVAGNNLQNLLDYNKTDEQNNDTHQFIYFKILSK